MHLKTNSIKHMQSLILGVCGSQHISVFSDICYAPCNSKCLVILKDAYNTRGRELLIHYHSDRINKQISSLPDILIKLKTEISAVL